TLLGVDPVADARVRRLHASVRFVDGGALRLALDPESILLTDAGLAHLGVQLGDRLALATASGKREFTIVGAVDVPGPTAVTQALRDFGFLPLAAAQRLFGHADRLDRVEIRLAPGVSLAAGVRAVAATVVGASVATPADATGDALHALDSVRTILVMNSLLALLVAVFFVYNTASASAAERTRDVGLLRCVGLTRGGLLALLAAEAAASGLLGLVAGGFLGIVLARGSLTLLSRSIRTLFLFVPPVSGVSVSGLEIAEAAALSIGVAVVASLLAGYALARQKPLEILKPALAGVVARSRIARAGWIGLALFVAAGVLLLVVPSRNGFSSARIAVLVLPTGFALLTPLAVFVVAGIARRRLAPRTRPPLWLALDAVRSHPARTATTITAFGLSLGLVVGQGGISRAMIDTLSTWLAGTIPGDVIIGANAASPVSLFPFSDEAVGPLRRLPGVDDVFRVRYVPIHVNGRKVMCFALDVAISGRLATHRFVEGDPDDVYRRCAAGAAVYVSDNLAWMSGIRVGDLIPIDAIDGRVELPVAGVIHDFNSYLGTVFMDVSLYRRLFHDPLVDFAELCLGKQPPADSSAVLAAARAALPPGYDFLRLTKKEDFVEQVMSVVSDLNNLSIVQMAVAILIGSVGIVVTVTLSVLSRSRELALLGAIGMDLRDRRRTVLFEVLGLAAASAALGVAIGNLVFIPGNLLFREMSGFTFGYRFPLTHSIFAVAVALATAIVASVIPLRRVQRHSAVDTTDE
ncbi:MAG: ABC transporter permease, partial [Planctomycetes bacterium]|nr:ABC transporter permease [Planctomycetota bacterium]